MKYPKQVWDQLKNITASELSRALKKDRWELDETHRGVQVYRHPDGRRITIHFHPQKTYTPNLLKALLDEISWSEKDLKRLKLIK